MGAIAGCVTGFVAAAAIAPHVPLDPRASHGAAVAAYMSAFAAVSAMAIGSGLRVPPCTPRALLFAAPILLAVGALAWIGAPSAPRSAALATGAVVIALLLGGGGIVGGVIGARIAHPGHLAVVAAASSLADLWSVLVPGAPSAAIAADAPRLSALALAFPMLGTQDTAPLLGLGDVLFVALYLAASRRHALGVSRTAVALACGLSATGLAVLVLARPIPALPFLGIAVLIAHPAARLPPPGERRKAVLALASLALLGGVLVLVLGR